MAQESLNPPENRRLIYFLLICFFGVMAWSLVNPREMNIWLLESFPALIALGILVPTYRRFRFTSLAYSLICIHAVILFIGAHYTYEHVPLFDWIRDSFGFRRNHYDRVGHFAQGFVPAIIAREILIRKSPLKPGGWLFYIVSSICLAISAAYELFEWMTSEIQGSSADAFLGTQGDPWDTQKDMLTCLIGALAAQLILSRIHNKMLSAFIPGQSDVKPPPAA